MKRIYDHIYNQVFSEYFTDLRIRRGLSRKDVAYFLHLNPNTFTCYETGRRDVPISVFKDMCRFYGIDFHKTFKDIDAETERRAK